MTRTKENSLKRLSQVYYLIWTGLALIAMLYLSNLFFFGAPAKPARMGSESAGFQAYPPNSNDTTFALPQKDVPPRNTLAPPQGQNSWAIHNDIAEIKREMSRLQARLGNMEKSESKIVKKVSQLEQGLTIKTAVISERRPPMEDVEITGSIVPRDMVELPGSAIAKSAAPKKARPKVQVRYLPMPQSGFADGADYQSVAALGLNDEPTQTLFGLYLGYGRNLTEVRAHWAQMTKDHGGLLAKLEARYVPNPGPDGDTFRLIAGPFRNAADALRICSELRAKASGCKQTYFTGEPL